MLSPEKNPQLELIYSLISGTKFIDFIKNKLEMSSLTIADIKDVIESNFMMLRAKKAKNEDQVIHDSNNVSNDPASESPTSDKPKFDTLINYDLNNPFYEIQSDSSTMIIIIYGEIQIQGKKYVKGQYLTIFQDQFKYSHIKIKFVKPSTLLYLNQQVLMHRIQYTKQINKRIFQFEMCLPTEKMALTKSQMKKLVRKIYFRKACKGQYLYTHERSKLPEIQEQDMLMIFTEGVFQVCYRTTPPQQNELKSEYSIKYAPVLQLQHNFFYFKKEMSNLYKIKAKSQEGIYGILPISVINSLSDGDTINNILRQINKKRQIISKNIEISMNYQSLIAKNQKLLSSRIHSMKTPKNKVKQQNLAKTRVSMLSKSLPLFSAASSLQIKKEKLRYETVQDSKYNKSRYFVTQSKGWSTRSNKTQKDIEKLNFESTYERTLQNCEDKLDRMRRYEKLKGLSKIKEKQWLSNKDLQYSKNNTFYKIRVKKDQKHIAKFDNLKRTFMVRSSGRMKSGLNFTDR